MKCVCLILVLFLLWAGVSACNHELEQPLNKAAKGEWQWMYSTGGVSGTSLKPINNTSITLTLTKDSTYIFYLNNEQYVSGNYSIRAAGNTTVLYLNQGIQINMLLLQPELAIESWDSSQLQLSDYSINDGYHHYFKIIK